MCWKVASDSRGRDEPRCHETQLAFGSRFRALLRVLGAETNQWYPDLVYDNHPVDQPKSPEEGYHLSVDLTDKALEFIQDAKVIAPDKPFLLYYSLGAAHAPHHAPKEWIERYKGRFDTGYEASTRSAGPAEAAWALSRETGDAADQPDRYSGDSQRDQTENHSPIDDTDLGHAVR